VTTMTIRSARRRRARSLTGFALAGVVIATSLTLVASPANAAALDPGARIVDGTGQPIVPVFTPSSGGELDKPTRVQVATGFTNAPGFPVETYIGSSRTFIIKNDSTHISVATRRTNDLNVVSGLAHPTIDLTGDNAWAVTFQALFTSVGTGTFPLVVTGDSRTLGTGAGVTSASIYYQTWITIDAQAKTWSIGDTAPAKTATTTVLAHSAVTEKTATLQATVSGGATGDVTFTSGAISKTAPIVDGVATTTVDGLTGGTDYTFTAAYAGSATHLGSSGTTIFTTLPAPEPAGTASPGVSVDVPVAGSDDPKGLKMESQPDDVILTGPTARTSGQPWTAGGALANVVVNDDRRAAGGTWTLSGKSTAFTGSGAAAGQTIAASALSWTGSNGAGFQAGTLDQVRNLATGTTATADADQRTTVSGTQLQLVVPGEKVAGAYAATLSLTLI
jgi:hypothetical protein